MFLISFLLTIIPFVPTNHYGILNNTDGIGTTSDPECWIRTASYYLTLYIPLGLSLLFSIFLLIYIALRFNFPFIRIIYNILCCTDILLRRKIRNRHKKKQSYKRSTNIIDSQGSIQSPKRTHLMDNQGIL